MKKLPMTPSDKLHSGLEKLVLSTLGLTASVALGSTLAAIAVGCEGAYIASQVSKIAMTIFKPMLMVASAFYAFDLAEVIFGVFNHAYAGVRVYARYLKEYGWKDRGLIVEDIGYKQAYEDMVSKYRASDDVLYLFFKRSVATVPVVVFFIYIVPPTFQMFMTGVQFDLYKNAVSECNFQRATMQLLDGKMDGITMTEFDPRLLMK